MTTSRASVHIVVGFDFSPLAELALREAAALAAEQPETAIHVVNVRGDSDKSRISHSASESVEVEIADGMKASAMAALRAYGADEGVEVFAHALIGNPGKELASLAEDLDADLIIVGSNGRRGIRRLVVGSVAEEVMRAATCPVLVMRPRRRDSHPELVPEPPCPDCVAVREATTGASWWCPEHDKPFVPAHRYSYQGSDVRPYHPDGLG